MMVLCCLSSSCLFTLKPVEICIVDEKLLTVDGNIISLFLLYIGPSSEATFLDTVKLTVPL